MSDLVLVTDGTEVSCRNAVYRPAVQPPAGLGRGRTAVASSIVADCPRRWRKPRNCLVRTPDGTLAVTAHPHPDGTVRLEGDNVDAIATALAID